MRKHTRTLLLLLTFAAIFPFVYPWKDGKPLLSWSDIQMPENPEIRLPGLAEIVLPAEEETTREPDQAVKLYRWQGADGGIQFSNEPPPEGTDYEIVEIFPDANLIQGQNPDTTASPTTSDANNSHRALASPLTVSPGEAMQLLEDAYNIREVSEQRLRQHEALTQ